MQLSLLLWAISLITSRGKDTKSPTACFITVYLSHFFISQYLLHIPLQRIPPLAFPSTTSKPYLQILSTWPTPFILPSAKPPRHVFLHQISLLPLRPSLPPTIRSPMLLSCLLHRSHETYKYSMEVSAQTVANRGKIAAMLKLWRDGWETAKEDGVAAYCSPTISAATSIVMDAERNVVNGWYTGFATSYRI